MKIIQRFTALMLSVMMLATSYAPVIASSQNLDSYLVDDTNTESILYTEEQLSDLNYAFYSADEDELIYNDEGIQTRSLWDVLDVVMAGFSWATFLNDPSLGNFGWAILDTAALLPFLPSSAYFRQGGKMVPKLDEVLKFANKSSKNKSIVKRAIKKISSSKAISLIRKVAKGYNLGDDVFRNHILYRHGFNSKVKGTSKFIKNFDIKNAIKRTLTDGTATVSANSNNRYGYVFIKNFYSKIGTDHGKSLNRLKVVINNRGHVVTAYPIK